jgi:WD40 repeat protein
MPIRLQVELCGVQRPVVCVKWRSIYFAGLLPLKGNTMSYVRSPRWPTSSLLRGAWTILALWLGIGATRAAEPAQVATTLKGHTEIVYALAFSPDGKYVATGSFDRTVRLWDTASGKEVKAFGGSSGHQNLVLCVAFSPDGKTLASGSQDNTVKLWELPSVNTVPTFAHGEVVNALALSPDGKVLAGAGQDGSLKLWNTADGKLLFNLKTPGALAAVGFSPDGKTVATGGADKKLRLWNVADGKPAGEVVAHGGEITAVAFAANNLVVSAGADGSVKVWRPPFTPPRQLAGKEKDSMPAATALTTGGTQLTVADAENVRILNGATGQNMAVAFDPKGTRVAAANGKIVKIWNASDGKEALTLTHPAAVTALAFSPDKTKLVTGAADQQARVWDLANGKELESFRVAAGVKDVQFHPSGASFIAIGDDKTATVFTPSLQRVLAPAGAVRALAVLPNGTHIVTGSEKQAATLWNLATGASERTFGPIGATAVAVSGNGALIATGGADQVVRLFNAADGKETRVFKVGGKVRGLAFSPNNQTLAAACEDRSLLTWNVADGKPLQTDKHEGAATAVVFAPESTRYYSSGADKVVRAWKSATSSDAPTKSFAHPNLVDAVAFNPAGTMLATGCHDGNLRVWDLAKGQPKVIAAHLQPTPAPIYCVAWTPDGKQVVTGSLDRSLKLWDVDSGKMVRDFKPYKEKEFDKGHQDGVFCAAFSPDGKMLASGGSDRSIKLWNVADGKVVREFANPTLKAPPNTLPGPVQAHPGWVYGLRFTADGKYLVSAGNAPVHQGYLGLWNVADGKLLSGETLPLGPFYSVAISPDGRLVGVACGPSGKQLQEVNAYLLKMPLAQK